MPISWNEIRHNAIRFSRDWTGGKSESAEKQTFWNEFFQVFGVSRRAVDSFEEPVKKISGDYGYIDLFWPGIVLVEHKSAGKDLGNAESQAKLLKESPALKPYVRPFMGSEEFLNNSERWCLWLVDAPPGVIRSSPSVLARVEAMRKARAESNRAETKELAKTPALFGEIRQPDKPYLLIPKVSSETRPYLPVGFVKPKVIANGSALIVPDATPFHFGILSSAMHMAWMRYTCGRMKSDYQCSSRIVYNNFPWPEQPTAKQREAVEGKAQKILDARQQFPAATLADLYDPLAMPPALAKAHAELDRAVDLCYRPEKFDTDRQRVEYLFALYEKLTAPLLPVAKSKRTWRGGEGKIRP